jgi:hypothetical protein
MGEFSPRSFGRNLVKLEHARKMNPGRQTLRTNSATVLSRKKARAGGGRDIAIPLLPTDMYLSGGEGSTW